MMRVAATALLFAIVFAMAGCSRSTQPSTATPVSHTPTPTSRAAMLDEPAPAAPGGQPRLAADPAQLADDLVADDQTLHDSAAPEATLVQAAHRQQAAYREIGYHPEWDVLTRPRIPAALIQIYDLNVDARRQLVSLSRPMDTVPAWHIDTPPPVDELLNDYHEAESASGVGWNYLAAINLIESHFGGVHGVSSAGAQGPMQFLPATFAAYGSGGDINSPHDSIMAAGRYLAANNFAADRDHAIYRYNHASQYVRAVNDYAAVLAADPAAFTGYYRWDVYYKTTAGDVLLPVGYAATAPIPAAEYVASHPQ